MPGSERIVNFWWKKTNSLHEHISRAFQAIANTDLEIPLLFAECKTSLLQKPAEISSENQGPVTCLNMIYKWFTSCLLKRMDQHLDTYGLKQGEQRGAKQSNNQKPVD